MSVLAATPHQGQVTVHAKPMRAHSRACWVNASRGDAGPSGEGTLRAALQGWARPKEQEKTEKEENQEEEEGEQEQDEQEEQEQEQEQEEGRGMNGQGEERERRAGVVPASSFPARPKEVRGRSRSP